MRDSPDDRHGWRVRAMIVVLWRAGLGVHEALALTEHDLDPRGSALTRTRAAGASPGASAPPWRSDRRSGAGPDSRGYGRCRAGWNSVVAEAPAA